MKETLWCALVILVYFVLRVCQHIMFNNRKERIYVILNILLDIFIFVGFLFSIGLIIGMDFSNVKGSLQKFIETQSARIIWTVVIVIVTSTVINVIRTILFRKRRNPHVNEKRNNTMAKVLMSLAKYFLYIVCVIVILGVWGVNVLPALAGLGIVGLVVGLGAQKLINDFVAGIFIVFEHHFDVGDTIDVGGFKGEVIDIGLKTTKIRNWQGRVKIIANGELTNLINDTLENTTFDIVFEVGYQEDVERVMRLLDQAFEEQLKDHTEIVNMPKTMGVNNLGSSGVGIKIVGSTKPESHYQLTRDMLQIIKKVCDDNNIEIPYNQIVVHKVND